MNIFYYATTDTGEERLRTLGWLGHKLKEDYKTPVILVDSKEDRIWLSWFFLPFVQIQVVVCGGAKIKDCDILVVAFRNHHKEGIQNIVKSLDCDLFDFVDIDYWQDYEIRIKRYEELYALVPRAYAKKKKKELD
jgi:hypothetical protein